MHQINISLQAARTFALSAQGLLTSPAKPAEKGDVLQAIRRMGALQIDTIHVVARSPYLVLWSRLGSYQNVWLEELLAEGALFEYWAHAACFLPREDFPIYRGLVLSGFHDRIRRYFRITPEEAGAILGYVRQNGAVRSADFERKDGQGGGWWNWKAEKNALEYGFTSGDLMIARRDKFQRVYDLRERVLPDWDDQCALGQEEALRALALKTLRALGVTRADWVADYFRLPKRSVPALLKSLADEGLIQTVQVEGWQDPFYVHNDDAARLVEIANGGITSTVTTLLSPFDPIIWDRRRTSQLFGFDYALECYLPAAKRVYGYFTLPILHNGSLVGRLDAKAYRKEGLFEVKVLYLEEDVQPDEVLAAAIASALRQCAAWHQTPRVVVRSCVPQSFLELLNRALNHPGALSQ